MQMPLMTEVTPQRREGFINWHLFRATSVIELILSHPVVLQCSRDNKNTTHHSDTTAFNLQAPCVLYIGQAFRYSPENSFYIFNQQIYFII